MHDDGYQRGSAPGLDDARKAEPLRHAPPPGRWVIWHGPQAQAAVDLAQAQGEPLGQPPSGLPPLPPGFPAPFDRPTGRWQVDHAGQRYFLHAETHSGYLSCYVYTLSPPDPAT